MRFVRRAYHIPTTHNQDNGQLTVTQAAKRLGVSADAIYYWIRHGQLTAHRDSGRLRIPFTPDIEQNCRERIAKSAHIHNQTQTPATQTPATGGAV